MKYKTNMITKLLYVATSIMLFMFICVSIENTNSWFTAGDGLKVECIVSIGKYNLNVYQVNTDSSTTLIKSTEENESEEEKSYVDLSEGNALREIVPDNNYSLKLTLNNTDAGNEGMYIRYKIEFYACGLSDTLLDVNLSGMTAPTVSNNGFIYDSVSEYYYYQNNLGVLQKYESGNNDYILSSFNIPYSQFGPNLSGAILKIIINIQCDETGAFS